MKKLLFAFVLILLLALPIGVSAANVTSYTSGINVANFGSSDADIVITFYDKTGAVVANVTDVVTLAAGSKTYYPLSAVSAGFDGSVVISSNQPVGANVNVLGNGGEHGAAYGGFSVGASTVNLPLIMKKNYGISTWFNVQNLGSQNASVDVSFAGTVCGFTNDVIVPAASKTYDQDVDSCLSNGYVGAATLTSDQPIVAVVMQVTNNSAGLLPSILAYNGFTSASTNPIMPAINSGYYKSGTAISIQNTGAVDTVVTVSYAPSAGFPGAACDITKSIPAGNSVNFGFPTMPDACYTNGGSAGPKAFVGGAVVSANSASAPLVAIVNQVTTGVGNASAYSAFNSTQGTTEVRFPLIMDRNYGIFTGIAVANIGVAPTNVICTFANTLYTASVTNLAPGASLNDAQLNKIGSGYVGSAVCTSTGEPIVGIVNQLNTGSVIPATDGLLTSEGVNVGP